MTVKAIVERKAREGRGTIVSLPPDATVREAARLMADHRIGAVLVCEGEGSAARMVGILSERDIVRALAEGADGLAEGAVSELMTREVERCALADTAGSVLARMGDGRFRHMPVMDGRRLAGMVSITDIARHRVGEAEREAESVMEYVGTNARGL